MKSITSDALPPQLETWSPRDSRLQAIVSELQSVAGDHLAYEIDSLDSVGLLEIEQANATAFVGAAPHTDKSFPRWFIMLTIKAPEGTVLHTATGKRLKKGAGSELSGDLVVGEVLLFDAHQVHWVDIPDAANKKSAEKRKKSISPNAIAEVFQDELSIIVGTEVDTRPTRDQAEVFLAEYLAEKTPKAWGRMLSQRVGSHPLRCLKP